MTKVTLQIKGMHCASCSMRIDGDLEELEGVKTSSTSLAKATTEVDYDESIVKVEDIKNVITKAGYSV